VVNYIPAIIIISLLKFNFIFKFNFFIKIGYDVCYYMFFTKEVKSVYKNQFMNLIKRELPRAVLLFGDDNFYIDRIIDFYIKRTNSQNSVLKYYFDEYNFDSIKNNLSQSSLFGDTNFIIIKRDKRVSKTEMEKLIDLTLKSDNNYLIFHFLGGYLDIKPLLKSFDIDNRAIWVRFFKPTNNEIISILEEKARELNKFISRENLNKLITILDGDIDLMVKEIEKLSLLDRAVKAEYIDRLVYSTTPIFIDKFLVKLFRKDIFIYPFKKLLEFWLKDEFSIRFRFKNKKFLKFRINSSFNLLFWVIN